MLNNFDDGDLHMVEQNGLFIGEEDLQFVEQIRLFVSFCSLRSDVHEDLYEQQVHELIQILDEQPITLVGCGFGYACSYVVSVARYGIFCQRCTCESCGNGAHIGYNCSPKVLIISNPEPCYNQNVDEFLQTLPGFHPTCYSGDENSFTCDSNLNFMDDSPNPPLQPLTDSYEFYGDDGHYGHDCPPQVSFIYNPEPDDESFSDEEVSKEIYSYPLFDEEIISIKIDLRHFNAESDLIKSLLNQDSLIISSPKIDSLLEEFSGRIRLIKKLLYDNSSPRPSKEPNSKNSNAIIESFSPSLILVEDSGSLMEEIDLFLTLDDSIPPGIKNDDYDSERDILFLEELLSNNFPSLPENESFHFDVSSSPCPPVKPPNDDGSYFKPDTGLLTAKVVGDISKQYDLMPRLLPTQPTLCPVIDTLLLFSSENEDKVNLLSHRGFNAFQLISKSPMMIYGGDRLPRILKTRARSFVLRSLDLYILSFI
nr:hypothetical protein [Tanacetum cinerariifolium]